MFFIVETKYVNEKINNKFYSYVIIVSYFEVKTENL